MSAPTLSQYLLNKQCHHSVITPQLEQLIMQVSIACKAIGITIGKGALAGVLGQAGSENIQGEEQKKLDIITNDIMLAATSKGGCVAGLASEEMEDIYPFLLRQKVAAWQV